jgi:dihydrofolate reductase
LINGTKKSLLSTLGTRKLPNFTESNAKIDQMRKLIYAINQTVDGCFDHTNMLPDAELFEYFTNLVRDADYHIFGRITYQLMVPYWPDMLKNPSAEEKSDVEFAEAFDATKKVVFSRTLDRAEGKNTRIIHSDLQEEVTKLKQEQGNYMLVGGVSLPSQLIAMGLVDEFIFIVHPIIAGKEKRLMEGIDLREKLQLKLVESKALKSGSVLLHYVKQ